MPQATVNSKAKAVAEGSRDVLAEGLNTLGIAFTSSQLGALETYAGLLRKWSRAFNLVGRSTIEQLETVHILDSAALLPFIEGQSLADLGSGAGLPGIVLATLRPSLDVTLIDSNQKKATFCVQAVNALGLSNVDVQSVRIEALGQTRHYDISVSRALASADKLWAWSEGLLREEGMLLAMKGRMDKAEIELLRSRGLLVEVHRLSVPRLTGERHVLAVRAR